MLLHIGTNELVLRGEVVVERRLGDAGLGDDPVYPYRVDALGIEEGPRSGKDTPAGGAVALFGEQGRHAVDTNRQVCLAGSSCPDQLAPAVARELVEATHHVCPYSNATRGNIPVNLVIE